MHQVNLLNQQSLTRVKILTDPPKVESTSRKIEELVRLKELTAPAVVPGRQLRRDVSKVLGGPINTSDARFYAVPYKKDRPLNSAIQRALFGARNLPGLVRLMYVSLGDWYQDCREAKGSNREHPQFQGLEPKIRRMLKCCPPGIKVVTSSGCPSTWEKGWACNQKNFCPWCMYRALYNDLQPLQVLAHEVPWVIHTYRYLAIQRDWRTFKINVMRAIRERGLENVVVATRLNVVPQVRTASIEGRMLVVAHPGSEKLPLTPRYHINGVEEVSLLHKRILPKLTRWIIPPFANYLKHWNPQAFCEYIHHSQGLDLVATINLKESQKTIQK